MILCKSQDKKYRKDTVMLLQGITYHCKCPTKHVPRYPGIIFVFSFLLQEFKLSLS